MIEIAATTRRKFPLSRRRLEQALFARGGHSRPDGILVLTPMTGAEIRVKKAGWQWRFSVETQIHGPGLHIAFYELLKDLAAELKVTYKMEDPSQYARDMDPARLIRFYQQEISDIARELAAQPVNARMQVHWPCPVIRWRRGPV